MNLPKDFIEQMKRLLNDEYSDFEKQYDLPPTKGIRINPLKCNASILQDMGLSLDKIPYEEAYYLPYEIKLGKHPYHLGGLFYLQEPSAMIPVASIDILDRATVLDLCSAPGGKSTQIASRIPNGILVSNEVVPDRARILQDNIIRLGIKNCIITSNQPKVIAQQLPSTFDYVFVDAPCSGEGMFRKEEIAIKEWYKELTCTNSIRQMDILSYAKDCVKDGGFLIYSTCTFNTLENENVIENFLKHNNDFKLYPVKDNVRVCTANGVNLPEARRFYPHLAKGEGQFVVILKRTGTLDSNYNLSKANISHNEQKLVDSFISTNTTLTKYCLYKIKNNIYISEHELLNTKKLNVYTYGVCLGSVEKGRLIPHHQFFIAYGDYFKNIFNYTLDSLEINKFLHGEELSVDSNTNGYGVVQCNGYTLGGGKIVDGRLKNYYPKKLRLNV